MKIDSYSFQSASDWKFRSEDIEIRSVKQTALPVGTTPPERTNEGGASSPSASLDFSEDAKKLLERMRDAYAETTAKSRTRSGRVSEPADSPVKYAIEIRRNILEALLARLTGKKFAFSSISLDRGASPVTGAAGGCPVSLDDVRGLRPTGEQLVMTETQVYSSHYESESLRYEAKGLVNTADGRSISIDIGLNMSREVFTSVSAFAQTTEVSRMIDPLVLNFSGEAASLTERKFEFDIDSDGVLDSISFAAGGNGFLAFDRNGVGVIIDGSELFGPQSGSGFGELRAYDSDGNGWIDENDDIFSKLRVWSKDADGNDSLFTLMEADVGAIYLGDIATQYTLGSASAADGMLRSTSVFLKESGGAGMISHIDLAV
jgi:hypothetical protein